MLAMFKDVELPNKNERAFELLEKVNSLWEENSWLSGEKHSTQRRRVSYTLQKKLVEFATNSPEALQELLDSEICLDQLIQWVLDREEAVDF